MSYFYISVLFLTILLGACGDANTPPTNAETAPTEQPATTAPTTATPEAQPVANAVTDPSEVNDVSDPYAEECKKINQEVDRINENIGDYSKKQYKVDHNGRSYQLNQYFDNNGTLIKAEAIAKGNYWRFYAIPINKVDNKVIYATHYEETDNPYEPITKEFFGIGSLITSNENLIHIVDEMGKVVKGENRMAAEQAYDEAMIAFTAYR